MKPKEIKYDVGIVIGRFQIPTLHQAHLELIQSVVDTHSKVIIFLGLSPCKTTYNNPLDFEMRKQMILDKFPDVNVLYIKDEPTDEGWSKKLDNQIADLVGPNQSVALYGSRESFIPFYKGKYPTIELEPTRFISGTEIRKEISNRVKASPDFRAGVVWATGNQYPVVYPTVDIAIFDWNNNRILLGRKSNENKYRFIGGFATPNSDSYEIDAKREVMEESGIEVDDLIYAFSSFVPDWRYEKEISKIKTIMFVGSYIFGSPKASDDIAEVRWFSLDKLTENDFVETHKELFKKLKVWVLKNKNINLN
jgi:bifunctional NMN adenylyltransferase/nudix hydrolase